jgi:hypothetical protein
MMEQDAEISRMLKFLDFPLSFWVAQRRSAADNRLVINSGFSRRAIL